MSNKSKKAALTQTTEDYASRSSIHGIGYIFDRELKIADRLLWLLVVIAFAGVAAALTWNFWTQWRNEQVIMIGLLGYNLCLSQVVTVLKSTAKLVSEVPFPALTVCGSGVHMGNVERKLIEDFGDWRTKNKRSETSKEELKKDVGDFMEEKFQIKSNQTGKGINILDILDTMISPDIDVDVLFDANSVRENEIACQQVTKSAEDNAGCRYSCPDTRFNLFGGGCYHVSTELANAVDANKQCEKMGARLAVVSGPREHAFVWQLSGGKQRLIETLSKYP